MNKNNPKFFSKSSEVEDIESSVEHVVKSWQRRQKLQIFFSSGKQLDNHQNQKRALWRTHLSSFIESTPIHMLAISLLIGDLIFTILELSSSLEPSCTRKENEFKEDKWYHWAGISILILLSLKSAALAIGLGSSFFTRPGYVVDGAVVVAALLLEAFFGRRGGGLLAVVSLWRVVRVVESAFELSDEAIEAQIEGIVSQLERLKENNTRLLETIAEKNNIIENLQREADQCRLHFEKLYQNL